MHSPHSSVDPKSHHSEDVEVAGHIIDSLILPKILDEITARGGDYEIGEIRIGHNRRDPSYARLTITAATAEQLDELLLEIGKHGAVPVHLQDCRLEPADMDGAFPEGFYCTTNEDTEVRLEGEWVVVQRQEMDCGVVVRYGAHSVGVPPSGGPVQAEACTPTAACVAMADVRKGDLVVIGRQGTRIHPVQRDRSRHDAFSFMHSTVSSEKPKGVTVRDIARAMQEAKEGRGRILVVAGPAVVHTGSRDYFSALIERGYVQVLFAGNALATHDVEQSFFGTSLGISISQGRATEEGHEHHLRSINRVRRLGGLRQAVEAGVLTSGIMYQCVRRGIPYVLAGSIRDDGPLPDVITDVLEAQGRMRELCQDVTFCLMIATTLHSIATGNLLPARVKVVCVDINPATVTKLADRGTYQTVGVVTDVEPFLRVLVQELMEVERRAATGPEL